MHIRDSITKTEIKIDPATSYAAEILRYHQKQQEIHRTEENLRMQRLALQRLQPIEPGKGQNIDVTV